MSRMIRRGFTLIELLVVISIIGILMALLLPAIQYARESARKSQCKNNLKQLGLAAHNYLAAFGYFPTNITTLNGQQNGPTPQIGFTPSSWLYRMLPYLDQQATFDSLNGQLCSAPGVYPTAQITTVGMNSTAFNVKVTAFMCPSDPTQKLANYDDQFTQNSRITCTNYFGVVGSDQFNGPGIFANAEAIGPAQISDGMSKTLYAVERIAFVRKIFGPYDPELTLAAPYYHWGFQRVFSLSVAAKPLLPKTTELVFISTQLEILHGINPRDDRAYLYSSSAHPGGAMVLLADGSVQFLSEAIDQRILNALATKAGEDDVAGSW